MFVVAYGFGFEKGYGLIDFINTAAIFRVLLKLRLIFDLQEGIQH